MTKVEVRYTVFEPDHEHLETARDIRALGEIEMVDEETLEEAYTTVAEAEIEETFDDRIRFLENIYKRMQGGRRDAEIGYDGGETRSMMMGDVIIVEDPDGDRTAYFCDRIGFTELDLEVPVEA